MAESEPIVNKVFVHVMAGMCSDPDCEIHQIEVGIVEGTVSPNEAGWFLAGMQRMGDLGNADMKRLYHYQASHIINLVTES